MANERLLPAYQDQLRIHPNWRTADDAQADADARDWIRTGYPSRLTPVEAVGGPPTNQPPAAVPPVSVPPAVSPPTPLPPDMPPVNKIVSQPLATQPVPILPIQLVPGLPPLIVPQVNPPQCPNVDWASLVTAINALTNLLNTYQQNVRLYLSQQVSVQNNYLQALYAIIQGNISNRLDTVSYPVGKSYGKIKKDLSGKLGNCYANCFSLGMEYPSDEAVMYGLETGKCLESCQSQFGEQQRAGQTLVNENVETSCPPPTINVNVSAPNVDVRVDGTRPVSTEKTTTEKTTATSSTTSTFSGKVREAVGGCNVPSWMQGIADGITSNLSQGFNLYKLFNNGSAGSYADFYKQISSCFNLSGDTHIDVTLPPPPPPPEVAAAAAGLGPFKPKDNRQFTEQDGQPLTVPNWQNPDICALLDKLRFGGDLNAIFSFYWTEGRRIAPSWWQTIWGNENYADWSWFAKHVEYWSWNVVVSALKLATQITDPVIEALGVKGVAWDAALVKIIVGFIGHWTQGSLDGLTKGFDYKLNQSAPQEIPSQGELNAARLGDQIPPDQWTCLTQANNNLPELAKRVLLSQRSKISYEDALMLHRLGRMDAADYEAWTRQNGYIRAEDVKAKEAASIYLPGPSDLIHMMVRDVADNAAVKKFGLDEEFTDKWKGDLKLYGAAQGINDDTAKLEWRAHWDQISNTQAFQMLHRLRPGSKLVEDAANAINFDSGGEISMEDARAKLITTEETVRELLAINDTLPYWRDRLIAISYNPLTRTDAQRAYILGALDDAGLKAVYQDEGYDSSTADILVKFTQQVKAERLQRKIGSRSVGKLKSMFVSGLIDATRFEAEVRKRITLKEKADALIEDAKLEKELTMRAESAKCVQSSFMHGRVDAIDALEDLQKAGFVHSESLALIDRWKCAYSNKAKNATAERLCKWRALAIIDRAEQLKRLVRLGWTALDAAAIADQCEKGMSEAAQKKLAAQLREMEAKNKRLEAENLKIIKAKAKADQAAAAAAAARTAEVKARAEQGGALA